MDKKFISSVCVLLFLGTSCTISQPLSKSGTSSSPEFLDAVTLRNGNNQVEINQQKQVYNQPETLLEEPALPSATTGFSYLTSVQNPPLQKFISQWYGVPYLLGGTTKLGIDCSAFVQELYDNVYQVQLLRTASQQYSICISIPKWQNLTEGDLVFFKIRTRRISHVGVYLGNGKFVHASSSNGVMISDLNEAYWTRYYVGGGKIKDVVLTQNKI